MTNSKLANLDVLFDRDINKIPGEASLHLLTKGNRRIQIFQLKSGVCELLSLGVKNMFISIFMKEVLEKSNLPHKCPLLKNVMYSIKNYTLNDASYPPVFPEGRWQFNLHGSPNNIGMVHITLKGRVRK
uniref:Uncharacterized protein n=1 Tax=Stomoxys calcitrans TaxID=35570 RepID=A0A1I8Q2G2_STOCA